MIEIFQPGCSVLLDEEIEAKVREVLITKDRIEYMCSWWSANDHKTGWFESFQVTSNSNSKRQIGFKS